MMADKTTTHFETMGTSASQARAVSDPSPHLKFVPHKHNASESPQPATAGGRHGQLERLGAQFAPQVGIVYQNSPEASKEGRNVRLMPSAIGNRDFYLKRQYGQVLQ
jgi:hypothetical protein